VFRHEFQNGGGTFWIIRKEPIFSKLVVHRKGIVLVSEITFHEESRNHLDEVFMPSFGVFSLLWLLLTSFDTLEFVKQQSHSAEGAEHHPDQPSW
jgi:hypothetical protein